IIHRHAGVRLVAGAGGVDAELAADGRAGGGIALAVDAPAAAVLAVARPGDDEVAGAVHRHGGRALVTGGGGVDAELAAQGRAGGGVTLGVDAPAAAVLALTLPNDDEVAGPVGRHRLRAVGIGLLRVGGRTVGHDLGVELDGLGAARARD